MIFVSGIHGVGKSHFCAMVKEILGIDTYSASSLIMEKKKCDFSRDKLVSEMDNNQAYLLQALTDLKASKEKFILDGHFCLLNVSGEICRISCETFIAMHPDAIILLTEKEDVISTRRKECDNLEVSPEDICIFQREEKKYAKEIAATLNAQLFISSGADDLHRAIDFIKTL